MAARSDQKGIAGRALAVAALVLLPAPGDAQRRAPAAAAPPGLAAIREADIRADLFALAGDDMRGREAGTLDELRASMWVAERARAAGLQPAGPDGSWFQWWSLRRTRLNDASRVSIGGRGLPLRTEAIVWNPVTATVDLPLTWIGAASGEQLTGMDLRGKAVAALVIPPATPPVRTVTLRPFRYAIAAVGARAAELAARGAAAVVLVSDDAPELAEAWDFVGSIRARGTYGVDSAATLNVAAPVAVPSSPAIPIVWVKREHSALVQQTDARLVATLDSDSFTYPSVNVVARVPGTHPVLKNEYVLFSAHQDHDGVRHAVGGDSIFNGADDNASVSVGVLAIARAVARRPMARSALFVWHGAEERGLLGSRWHASRPVVPRDRIVAVLNADMIGRNHPDSAALLGVHPPHLNSRAMVAAAFRANAMTARFAVDTTWDNPSHPEGWHFRSDHLPYARFNIPSLYFSTLLHPDYHTPRDAPERIDVAKVAKVARWMYATGWIVGMAAQRPDLVPGFQLERE